MNLIGKGVTAMGGSAEGIYSTKWLWREGSGRKERNMAGSGLNSGPLPPQTARASLEAATFLHGSMSSRSGGESRYVLPDTTLRLDYIHVPDASLIRLVGTLVGAGYERYATYTPSVPATRTLFSPTSNA